MASGQQNAVQKKTGIIFPLACLLLGLVLGALGAIFKEYLPFEFPASGGKTIINSEENLKLASLSSEIKFLKKKNKDLSDQYYQVIRENTNLKQELEKASGNSGAGEKEEEEELAPGFNQCMQKAQGDFDIKDCYGIAGQYWDKQLNAIYPKVLLSCNKAENPKECRSKVNKMEVSWIKYVELMSDFIYGGSVYEYGGGTLARVNGVAFDASQRKKQCLLLRDLIDQ